MDASLWNGAPLPPPAWASADGASALYLGDALDLLAVLPEASVDCVWTDPPYLLSNDGVTCVAGKMVSVNKGAWDRSQGLEGDHEFNLAWTRECYRVLKPTGSLWVSGTLHLYPSVGMALRQNGFHLLNDITWEKTNPPPNLARKTFTHSTETLFWASKEKKGYTFNYQAMREENAGKQMKTVWQFPAASRKEKRFGKHPTQKPVALIRRCLRASTNPGDLVLDPFAGAASAGVAALELDRRFVGIEIEEQFVAIGSQRLISTPPPPPPPKIRAAGQVSRTFRPKMAFWERSVCAKKEPSNSWLRATPKPAVSWKEWCCPRWRRTVTRSAVRCTSEPASASPNTR